MCFFTCFKFSSKYGPKKQISQIKYGNKLINIHKIWTDFAYTCSFYVVFCEQHHPQSSPRPLYCVFLAVDFWKWKMLEIFIVVANVFHLTPLEQIYPLKKIHTRHVHYAHAAAYLWLMILKIRESRAHALFLYNCTPNTLPACERSVGCIHTRVGLIHLLLG